MNHESYAAVQLLLRLGILPEPGSTSAVAIIALEATAHTSMLRYRDLFVSLGPDDQQTLLAYCRDQGFNDQVREMLGT